MDKHKDRSAKGQSLVEFSFTAMFVLLLLAGIADFGRAFFTYMALRDAVQEGAAYGSAFPTDIAGIKERVRESSRQPVVLNNDDVDVTYTGGVACEGSGNGVKVTVEYDFLIATPFMGAFFGSQTIPLRATATDTILRPPC